MSSMPAFTLTLTLTSAAPPNSTSYSGGGDRIRLRPAVAAEYAGGGDRIPLRPAVAAEYDGGGRVLLVGVCMFSEVFGALCCGSEVGVLKLKDRPCSSIYRVE